MSDVLADGTTESTESEGDSCSSDMARKISSIAIEIDSKLPISKPSKEGEFDLTLLGFDLRRLPPTCQFCFCSGAVFFFFLIYGYFQELIFTVDGFKPYGWHLTLLQFAFYSVFGFFEVHWSRDSQRRISMKTYLLLAFLTVSTMGFSNASLGYLNYPTQVIFKCCKLIPVLIGGILIQGKHFSLADVVACLCMSVGLIFFTLADNSVSPSFSLYGVLLISLALCADAAIGNVQEKVMKETKATNAEVVLYSYAVGFLYILIQQMVSAQLIEATTFYIRHPELYFYTFVFSLTGYLGINIVLSLVKMYGALIAVTVTTCRKALTIILSFLLFTKPFTFQYVWSGAIVVLGIYLNVYSKNQARCNELAVNTYRRLCPRKQPQRLVALQNLQHIV